MVSIVEVFIAGTHGQDFKAGPKPAYCIKANSQ